MNQRVARREFLRQAGGGVAALAAVRVLRARPTAAGPVTTDRYGDMVQTVPRGELP